MSNAINAREAQIREALEAWAQDAFNQTWNDKALEEALALDFLLPEVKDVLRKLPRNVYANGTGDTYTIEEICQRWISGEWTVETRRGFLLAGNFPDSFRIYPVLPAMGMGVYEAQKPSGYRRMQKGSLFGFDGQGYRQIWAHDDLPGIKSNHKIAVDVMLSEPSRFGRVVQVTVESSPVIPEEDFDDADYDVVERHTVVTDRADGDWQIRLSLLNQAMSVLVNGSWTDVAPGSLAFTGHEDDTNPLLLFDHRDRLRRVAFRLKDIKGFSLENFS